MVQYPDAIAEELATMSSSNNDSSQQTMSLLASPGKGQWMGTLCLRLFLLVMGAGLAAVAGIGVATVYPHPTPSRPWWAREMPQRFSGIEASSPEKPVAYGSKDGAGRQSGDRVVGEVSSAQNQALQVELQQLQGELKALRDRTTALEAQVGQPQPSDPIEARLQSLAQQLAVGSGNNVGDAAIAGQPVAARTLQTNQFIITLPNDILFQGQQTELGQNASTILNPVVAELTGYQGAAIRIAAHTDSDGDAAANLALSFQRAQLIQQYLSARLETQFHWVVVGYGETRPLVENATASHRQRNRRIEIGIDP